MNYFTGIPKLQFTKIYQIRRFQFFRKPFSNSLNWIMELSLKPKYHQFGKLFSICIYLVFSIYYIVFSTLPSGKQVLYITIFVLRICFFKPNITPMHLGFSYFVHGSLWKYNCRVFRFFKYHARLSSMQTWHLNILEYIC